MTSLREARDVLVDDRALRGVELGRALADLLDGVLVDLLARRPPSQPVALVALGSYARRELCPGSDVDVLLLHTGARGRKARELDLRGLSEHLWYPLWDAGLVLGHAARTVKEFLALADDDLDALTTLVDARHVAGDAELTSELVARGRGLVHRRSDRLVRQLADASELRRLRPGPVAEMLEPDLKDGAGGLRDLQALDWVGWALDAGGGLAVLEQRGYLAAADVARLRAARPYLLDVRVQLHRVTGGKSDLLALQEQDAVAEALGAADADAMVRDLARVAREVAWIAHDAWDRLRASVEGPHGRSPGERVVAEGVVLRDGRITVAAEAPDRALTLLEAAVAAAEHDVAFERATLDRLRDLPAPTWDVWERAAFLRLLRQGETAVPVFEALDHANVLTRVLPEWEHVRSRPQRNAYHRFTVDRHLLEAVARGAALLDAGDADGSDLDAVVARACRRPELLLLAALLHDIGKGRPGDHSVAGATTAGEVGRRIGLDSEGVEVLVFLVRHHLLMAEVATRRDLADATTVERFAETLSGDAERLRLLYLLTIADSRATGPAAWGRAKAALVRDLFTKAATVVEREQVSALAEERRDALVRVIGEAATADVCARMPAGYLLAFDAATMAAHRELLAERDLAVACAEGADGRVVVTVAAPDRTGLLATVAGALTSAGLTVREANLFSTTDGMALDVFRAEDDFGRFADAGAERVRDVLRRALAGELDVAESVRARADAYRSLSPVRGPVEVRFDLDASETATVVEVAADDEIGLLFRVADAFANAGVDVSVAKAATLGDRVVDVFYVRDARGAKIDDPESLAALRAALETRLADRGDDAHDRLPTGRAPRRLRP